MAMKILLFVTLLLFGCDSGSSPNNEPNNSPAGNRDTILILNKSANTAWQLDAETGERIAQYQTGEAPHEVAVSPDQNRAIITNYGNNSAGNSLTIIDLNNQQVSKTISLGQFQRPHGVVWFSDGQRGILTAENQQAVLIIDIDSEEILSNINTDQEISHMVELSDDEETAYVTNLGSGSLSILDLTSNQVAQTIQTGDGTEGLTFVPDKNEVWITNRSENTITILDANTNQVVESLTSSAFPIRAEVSPNRQFVAVSNAESSEVSIFDVDARQEIQKVSTAPNNQSGTPIGLTFSADGDLLFVANSTRNEIVVIDTQNWVITTTFATGATPDGIAFISAGSN